MNPSLNLDLPTFTPPKNPALFKNSTNRWEQFREKRFKLAGDGEYVVIRNLDLSGYALKDFVVGWLAFVQCNLDGVSFQGTRLQYETAFINCSMKHVDLSRTNASDALFLNCDLAGATFSTHIGWSTVDLDGKQTPSVFSGCILDAEAENFLLEDGCVTDKTALNQKQQLKLAGDINDKLYRIITAPTLDA